jgi:hypothetical protein
MFPWATVSLEASKKLFDKTFSPFWIHYTVCGSLGAAVRILAVMAEERFFVVVHVDAGVQI